MVTIVDYGAGNLSSVVNAVRFLGETPHITARADEIASAGRIILPGVGAFGESMKRLRSDGAADALVSAAKKGAPILGICLGLQLMFDYSTEFGHNEGLGLISGGVEKLAAGGLKLPHIAWTSIDVNVKSRLFEGINSGEYFYFVHGYRAKADDPSDEAATAEYGERFTAAVERGNIFATQFHPEKSGGAGLKVLSNFLKI